MHTHTAHTNDYTGIRVAPELAERLRVIFGLERAPATLGDLAAAYGPGGEVQVREEDLYSDGPSRHAVRLGGGERHTHCVMDALMVPAMTGEAVEVRSEGPLGDTVGLRLTPEGVETDSPDAVVSFGVARRDQGAVQQTACPYINVFPSPEAYERWAAATPEAITMALPLGAAAALARDLALGAQTPRPRRGCC